MHGPLAVVTERGLKNANTGEKRRGTDRQRRMGDTNRQIERYMMQRHTNRDKVRETQRERQR